MRRLSPTRPAVPCPRLLGRAHGLALPFALVLALACGPSSGPEPAPPTQAAAAPAATPPTEEPPTDTPDTPAAAEPPTATPPELELDPGEVDPRTLGPEVSTSIGSPADGSLRGGVPLPRRGPGFRFHHRKRDEARYGTVETVQAVLAAAAAVAHEFAATADETAAVAVIGELSLADGGPLSGHGSHQAGRDVDVLFFLLDSAGDPFPSEAIPLDPSGAGTEYGDLADPSDDRPVTLDAARTWRFVQGLLEHEGAHEGATVQRIFVVEHLRTLLLEEAERVGAPPAIRERFAMITCQPGFPHDDHLHIRFFCSPDDIARGCTDMAPIYPWQREALRARGQEPVVAKPRRAGSRPKLTTHAEARAKAGPMHSDVVDFLDRRKAWTKRPHPGRPYCR